MQLHKFNERSFSIMGTKELFLVGLISVVVFGCLSLGFFAILEGNQQVITALSAQAQQQPAQADPSILATIMKKQPILTDSLRQNTDNRWLENAHCIFQGGSYHILLGPSQQQACGMTAEAFRNVAIQVEMSLLSGQEAGLLFRVQFQGPKEYYFGLDHLQRIFFCIRDGQMTCPLPQILVPGVPIKHTNLLFVLAQANTISLYMNGVFVYRLQDETSSNGFIGFNAVAGPSTQSGNASFANLKVYQI